MTRRRMNSRDPSRSLKPVGESWVWFSGMGLATGLVMIAFLLGMIFFKGVVVFWPKPVVRLELHPGSSAGIGDAPAFGGEIVKRQERVRQPGPQEHVQGADEEWQLFVGNKGVYGFSYKYVDVDEIAAVTRPQDVVVAERVEYGDAIFMPRELRFPDGRVLPASSPEFESALHRLVEEANERRAVITEIERLRIGTINRRIDELQLERRVIEERGVEAGTTLAAIDARIEALQAEYALLAAEAQALRGEQRAVELRYETLDGQERGEPAGNILRVYRPNRLGFWDKVGLFLHGFWTFLSTEPREANTEGGVLPAIFGTFVMTIIMSAAVTPFGVLAAIYLREYARQGSFVRCVRIAVNNLAGVPSIVFGVFGLGFFVYLVGGTIDDLFYHLRLPTPTFGTGGILWASLTLALMTVPVVIVATEEALAAVSRGTREGSLACGASKWQTIQRIVLPASVPGILTGLILAMARGAGEVAPLMLVGVVKLAPTLPVDLVPPFIHLERKFMHLGFHIYDLGFQSPDSEAARPMVFATTFLLILLVVTLNLGAIVIRNQLRKRYRASTF